MAAEARLMALVETDFLFGLRRSDARNPKVLLALEAAGRGELALTVLSSAVVEARTVMYSRGMDPADAEEAVSLMDSVLAEHGVRDFLPTELADVVVAERLRSRHPELGYFDSLHAASASRLSVPILGSEGAYPRIGVPFIDLDRFGEARQKAAGSGLARGDGAAATPSGDDG